MLRKWTAATKKWPMMPRLNFSGDLEASTLLPVMLVNLGVASLLVDLILHAKDSLFGSALKPFFILVFQFLTSSP